MRKPMFLMGFLCLMMAVRYASAQSGAEQAFFCTVDFAGGLSFNASRKQWQSTHFRPAEKFVLRIRFLGTRTEKIAEGLEMKARDHTLTITPTGTSRANPCVDPRKGSGAPLTLYENDDVLECSASLHIYKFNIRANRFLSAYLHGFVEGDDDGQDTPSVAGGMCTKIN